MWDTTSDIRSDNHAAGVDRISIRAGRPRNIEDSERLRVSETAKQERYRRRQIVFLYMDIKVLLPE